MKDLFELFQTPKGSVKHSKCKGYKIWTSRGYEYDCEYQTNLPCDECKYGTGRKDLEAKCNARE